MKNKPKCKINVLHIIGDMDVGGAERQLSEVVPRLNGERYNIMICCLRYAGQFGNILKNKGFEVFELKKKAGIDFTILPKLIGIMKRKKIHIIQTYMFTSNLWGGVAAKIAGVPIILLGIRGLGIDASWYEFLYLKLFSKFVYAIIFNSFTAMNYYINRSKIPPKICEVFYNGIDIPEFTDAEDRDWIKDKLGFSTDKIICTVGRLAEVKGHRYLLKAFREVLNKYKNVKLLLIGDGELNEELKMLAQKLKIDNHVTFLGRRNDVMRWIQASDILVLPSLHESFPNAILEAMMCGKPVVASKVGGIPELLVDNQTGLLVPPQDSHSLAEHITELLLDESKAKEFGVNGRHRVENFFSFDILISKIENLYESLIKQKLPALIAH